MGAFSWLTCGVGHRAPYCVTKVTTACATSASRPGKKWLAPGMSVRALGSGQCASRPWPPDASHTRPSNVRSPAGKVTFLSTFTLLTTQPHRIGPIRPRDLRDDATEAERVQNVSCAPWQRHVQCPLNGHDSPWLPRGTVARQRRWTCTGRRTRQV